MHIIVPVKSFENAKTRLAGSWTSEQRIATARAMAEHVLSELAPSPMIDRVIVASSEPSLAPIVARLGFELLPDAPEAAGLNAVILRATEAATADGALDIGVIMADLPLFSSSEFAAMIERHRSGTTRQMTIVRDRLDDGTTIRLCRPGSILPCYGRGSADRHERAAIESGMTVVRFSSPSLACDLDRPEDLKALLRLSGTSGGFGMRPMIETWPRQAA